MKRNKNYSLLSHKYIKYFKQSNPSNRYFERSTITERLGQSCLAYENMSLLILRSIILTFNPVKKKYNMDFIHNIFTSMLELINVIKDNNYFKYILITMRPQYSYAVNSKDLEISK